MFSSRIPSIVATGRDVLIVQPVPGVQGHAELPHERPPLAPDQSTPLALRAGLGQRIRARVQLDRVGGQILRGLDLPRVGIEKQAHKDTRLFKRATAAAPTSRLPTTSSPPSVVTSSRRSGTSVA